MLIFKSTTTMRKTSLVFLVLLLPFSCSFLGGQNYISLRQLTPIDSSDVTITDTIWTEIEYSFGDEYDDADGVPLVLELLCSEISTGEEIILDTLKEQHGFKDIPFTLGMFSNLCEYSNRPSYYVADLKLVLGKDGKYDRVVKSGQMHYFLYNRL